MLSNEQISFFDAFGFLVFPGLFAPEEMEAIDREFEDVMAEDRAGQAFRGDKRHAVTACAEMRPGLRSLIEDDRVYGAIEDLLGPEIIWLGSDGNYYTGDTAWHSDGTVMDIGRIKVALYLDPVARDSGCLRFIPGSHKMPLHEELQALRVERTKQTIQEGRSDETALDKYRDRGIDVDAQAFDTSPDRIPAFAAESRPGDVIPRQVRAPHGHHMLREHPRPRQRKSRSSAASPAGRWPVSARRTSPKARRQRRAPSARTQPAPRRLKALAYPVRDWRHHRAFLPGLDPTGSLGRSSPASEPAGALRAGVGQL